MCGAGAAFPIMVEKNENGSASIKYTPQMGLICSEVKFSVLVVLRNDNGF